MFSLQKQIVTSGNLAHDFLVQGFETDPLSAWQSGIDTVRLSLGDPDPNLTEEMHEVSAIAYHAVRAGHQLLGGQDDAFHMLVGSHELLDDLTKNQLGQSRRCGSYLMTAPALNSEVQVLTVENHRLAVPEIVRKNLEPHSAFSRPDLFPVFWLTAHGLVCKAPALQ